jgi:hypothetical protein
MFRDETSKYTDPLSNGTARLFSLVMDVEVDHHCTGASGKAHA